MAGRRKKNAHAGGEHENAERWLLTYADMITLLVAFFIMLYAMSVMNQQKFQQLAVSVRSGFGGSITNGAPTVIDQGGGMEGTPSIVSNGMGFSQLCDPQVPSLPTQISPGNDQIKLDRVYQIIERYIQINHLQSKMNVMQDERGVVVTLLTDRLLFAEGSASLRSQETSLLNTVARAVNTVPNHAVRIEGYTDNLPIHTSQFPSNWELSALRATTVLQQFLGDGVDPSRLAAVGYGDQRPLTSNATAAGRAANRRVEIVILRDNAAAAEG